MAPKKKAKGKKTGGQDKNQTVGDYFEPVTYITNKVSTMIEMLDSPEPMLLLRVIGTLNKIATQSQSNLEFMLGCEIYPKLLELLKSTDTYTVRFTLSMIEKVVANTELVHALELGDLFTTALSTKEHYLKSKDDLVRNLSTSILLSLCKINSMVSGRIYCCEVVTRIFEFLTTIKVLEFAVSNLQVLFYVLDSPRAPDELLNCNGFSIQLLLCLLVSERDSLKQISCSILHKLAMWKNGEVILALAKEKVAEAMMRLTFLGSCEYELTFETIYACLLEYDCALNFVKSIEFVKFLEWVKTCPRKLVGHCGLIMKTLSDHEELLQVLFDFSMEESAIFLFRFLSEKVVLHVCDIILNMMRHKYCLESMARPSLMRILVEIIHDEEAFTMIPYRAKALLTLYRFFESYAKTVKLVYESDSINMLIDFAEKAKAQMDEEGYLRTLDVILYILKSEYSHTLKNIGMYQLIIDLYVASSFDEEKILTLMDFYLESEEFREVFLERGILGFMMEKIRKRKNIDCSVQTLLAIKKLLPYENVGKVFLNGGYLADLRFFKEHLKFETPIVDEIIDMILDFCLSIKFYCKNRLEENDKVRDQFMLVPDVIMTLPSERFVGNATKVSDRIPIYVVHLCSLQAKEREDKLKSIMDIRPSDKGDVLYTGSRRFGMHCDNLSPFYYLTMGDDKKAFTSQDTITVVQGPWFAQDEDLVKVITSLYDELYELHPEAYERLHSRVKCVAMRVSRYLSNSTLLRKHIDPAHAFQHHVRKLIALLDTNFVPIGRLMLGFQCERALMFKVVCDQLKVPTTLCKHGDSYYNEVALFRQGDRACRGGPLVQKRFLVDLMEDAGELIPLESVEAAMYLERYKTKFN